MGNVHSAAHIASSSIVEPVGDEFNNAKNSHHIPEKYAVHHQHMQHIKPGDIPSECPMHAKVYLTTV